MRFKRLIFFLTVVLLTSRANAQNEISFDANGWDCNQTLDSNFTVGNTVFRSSRPFYTNYGYNLNVYNTGIYFVFQDQEKDQFTIAKQDNKLFNFKSISAYQVSESSTSKLIIEGWNGANKVYTSAFSNITTWQKLSLNFERINKLVIKLEPTADGGMTDYNFDNLVFSDPLLSVVENGVPVYHLDQNYPNPFNPSTVITYQIPKHGRVTLKVYDTMGNEVCTLVNGYKDAGSYSATFDAGNLSSGIYIYKLRANEYVSTKKMILIK